LLSSVRGGREEFLHDGGSWVVMFDGSRTQWARVGDGGTRSDDGLTGKRTLTGIRLVKFQAPQHEVEQVVPTLEVKIAGQRTDIVEEGLAGWEGLADELIFCIAHPEHGMEQQGEQIEGSEQGGQMLFAVSEVVGQMVALGLQGIVVFVFHFPTGTPGLDDIGDVVGGNFVVGGKGIFVDNGAVGAGRGELTPVHLQGIVTVTQGDLVDETIGIGLCLFAPTARLGQGLHATGDVDTGDPLVEGLVGIGFAYQHEVEPLREDRLTQGLAGVEVIAQHTSPQCAIACAMLGEPAFGGGVLAILLAVPVLGDNEFGLQRDDGALFRGGDDWGDDGMGVGGLITMVRLGALCTMDLPGGVVLGAIQCDQQIPIERAKGL